MAFESSPERTPFLLIALACLGLVLFGCDGHDDRATSTSGPDAVADAEPGPDPAVITADNVYANEAHWPAIVALTENWQPEGESKSLQAGYRGALVRVTEDGDPRIDFGRHGKHIVPAEATDLVSQANAVRSGEAFKGGPNFLRQIGTRLLSIDRGTPRAIKSVEIEQASAYLCVFADPRAEDFTSLAQRLAEATEATSIQTIFFPQAVDRTDMQLVRDQLTAAEWIVPFAYPRLSEDYTQSILGDEAPVPAMLMLSPEGRVLYRAGLDAGPEPAALRAVLGS